MYLKDFGGLSVCTHYQITSLKVANGSPARRRKDRLRDGLLLPGPGTVAYNRLPGLVAERGCLVLVLEGITATQVPHTGSIWGFVMRAR